MNSEATRKNWQKARDYLVKASVQAEVDPGIVAKIARYESGFNDKAAPITKSGKRLSSAYGYGQFLRATWVEVLKLYGAKYKLNALHAEKLRLDPMTQAWMLAEFTKNNIRLGGKYGGTNDDANVYALHNLGAKDAIRFLKALKANKHQPIANVLSQKVIAVNGDLYGDGSRSLERVYAVMAERMAAGNAYADDARKLAKEKYGHEI